MSYTQTVHRPPAAGRRHDYLYDRDYVVGSEKDHVRDSIKARTDLSRVQRVPEYKTMFSELRHKPRFRLRLQNVDPVPPFIKREWRGYGTQALENLTRQYKFDPQVRIPKMEAGTADVGGKDRALYFRRPIIPFLQQMPPEVLLAQKSKTAQGFSHGDDELLQRAPSPLTKTITTQTDYRESEAQTDPYSPEYVVRPGSQPELLTLATLAYERGLPAGLAEVEMIERARAKRAWEATLPALSDTTQLEKRRAMMDEQETKEWALRESEIEKLQEARLTMLKKMLKQREETNKNLTTKRLDKLWKIKQEDKESRFKKLRKEHVKAVRKLVEQKQNVENTLEKRKIISEYVDPGSQVYAPMTRLGVFMDRGCEQFVVKSKYLSTYRGLLELEAFLPASVTQPRIRAPRPKSVHGRDGYVKRRYKEEMILAEIHRGILDGKEKKEEPPKPLRFLQKIEKPIPRPPTPTVEVPSEEDENAELATIFLQQIIRGRAIQNMMFEGKTKRFELIKELRSTHALQKEGQAVKDQEKATAMAIFRQRGLHIQKEAFVDEAISNLEGTATGDMLDFLAKELIRLQEERRIHAFAMLAERERRIREAEESGRRQVEERRRREEDEIFKQMVKVHQTTVDTYLEDIILAATDKTADDQARDEIKQVAAKINDIAYELEEQGKTETQSAEIVAEMVHGFMIPEVQKQTLRDQIHAKQRKHLVAAHRAIHGHALDVAEQIEKKDDENDE